MKPLFVEAEHFMIAAWAFLYTCKAMANALRNNRQRVAKPLLARLVTTYTISPFAL